MIMFFAGNVSYNLQDRPEKVLPNEKIGVMFTYYEVFKRNSSTVKRIAYVKKKILKGRKNEDGKP